MKCDGDYFLLGFDFVALGFVVSEREEMVRIWNVRRIWVFEESLGNERVYSVFSYFLALNLIWRDSDSITESYCWIRNYLCFNIHFSKNLKYKLMFPEFTYIINIKNNHETKKDKSEEKIY